MASRQLGKLRQWAGEVISSKEKTSISEEFQDLERDIELRKNGAQKVLLAADAYHHALSKKSLCEALSDTDKLLPIDALGIVMIMHGDEFPEDSDFGTSLVKIGRAHCKIATLQEAYALTFKDTFISTVEKFRDEIKEYEVLRKKLETRKVAVDTATIRHEKMRTSKKDKDRQEAEEEYERSMQRYDETAEDMRAHMHEIQDKEISQQKELTHFLDLEINFVQQYLEVLREVRDDWPDKTKPTNGSRSRSKSRSQSVSNSRPILVAPTTAQALVADSSEDEAAEDPRAGSRFIKHRKSPSLGARPPSRPPSRPSSRLSRKRTNSSGHIRDEANGHEEKEKDKQKPRRFSVAGWASNAVDSITPTKKSLVKDKETFASLDDDEMPRRRGSQESDRVSSGSIPKSNSFSLGRRLSRKKKSKDNISVSSPKAPPKILKPPSLQDTKHVHAVYDFKGGPDELSFTAGQDIRVINEVVDGWWMGETNGRKGLFPTTHVSFSPPKHSFMGRSKNNGNLLSPVPSAEPGNEGYITSDLEEEVGYHKPMTHSRSPINPTFFNDASNVTDQEDEPSSSNFFLQPRPRRFSDDLDAFMDQHPSKGSSDKNKTPKMRAAMLLAMGSADDDQGDPVHQPLISRSTSDPYTHTTMQQDNSPTKRVPPPPPPRRFQSQTPQGSTPVIPQRKLGPAVPSRSPPKHPNSHVRGKSNSGSNESMSSAGREHASNGVGYDVSPFESAAELSNLGCGKFKQNPFQPPGMCGNCRAYHS